MVVRHEFIPRRKGYYEKGGIGWRVISIHNMDFSEDDLSGLSSF